MQRIVPVPKRKLIDVSKKMTNTASGNSESTVIRRASERLQIIDFVLRRGQQERDILPVRQVFVMLLVFGPVYGMVMGSYNWVVGNRSLVEQVPQMLCSAIKVPLLITVTLLVAIPSFFVINTLMGLRDDFRSSIRAIVSAQAGLTIILASLLPLTVFSYISLSYLPVSYQTAVLFNAAMFGLASVSAQLLLRRYYRSLIAKNNRHKLMVRLWIIVYAFVGIQAAYVLRPFIGSPNEPTTFFRRESFENAYVKIWSMISDILSSF